MSEYIVEITSAVFKENEPFVLYEPKINGEIIRCKDCIHCWKNSVDEYICQWDEDETVLTRANGFCHKAERKEI